MVSYSVKLKGNFHRIKKDGTTMLYLLIIINRSKKMIGLNIYWPVDFIDNNAGVIMPRHKKDIDFNDNMLIINNELSKINEIFKIYRIQDRLLTMDLFNRELSNSDFRKDFLAFMKISIQERYKTGEITNRTKLNHTTTYNRLYDWAKSISFFSVDSKFLRGFAIQLERKIGNNDNTVWTRIKDVVTYLNLAKSEGIRINPDYVNYKNVEGGSSLHFLETYEINKLVKLHNSQKLPDSHKVVLKAFLFSCFSSLRISDVQRANWKWVNINSEMTFIPWKTRRFKKEIRVPLSPIAKLFIENKGGKFFHLPSDAEVNRRLKDISFELNIKVPLTFKTSRHTFGTHYYRYTKDLVSLQNIMGHSKVNTTMIYVHANSQDAKIGMNLLGDSFVSPEFDLLLNPKPQINRMKFLDDDENEFSYIKLRPLGYDVDTSKPTDC